LQPKSAFCLWGNFSRRIFYGNGWCVKIEHAQKASKCFMNKKDAVDYARKVSKNQGTELVIHNKNGRISQKESHGNDLFPPKG